MSVEFSEKYPWSSPIPLELLTQVRSINFEDELHRQESSPPAGDVRIKAACQAMIELWEEPRSPFRQMIETCMHARMEHKIGQLSADDAHNPSVVSDYLRETGSFDVNRALRGAQHGLLLRRDRGEVDYPKPFYNSYLWKEVFQHIAEAPDEESGRIFQEDFTHHGGHANVTERYKAIALAARAFPERLQGPKVLFDGGCSLNLGMTRLILHAILAEDRSNNPHQFEHITVKEHQQVDGKDEFRTNPRATSIVRHQLTLPHDIVTGVGVDIENPHTLENQVRFKADSFYPSELLIPPADSHKQALEELYDLLLEHASHMDNVKFFQGDLARFDRVMFEERFPGFEADISILSTLLYLMPESWRKNVIETALHYTKDSGILIINEFAHVDPEDPSSLKLEQHWFEKPFPYGTFVIFPEDPTRIYEIFRWSNGRCRELMLGKDAARLGVQAALRLNN